MQGPEFHQTAEALRAGDLNRAPMTPAERQLLEFIETLTKHAYRITDEQVQGLRDARWTDAQIAEAVYVAAFFNMMVRIADAFGIRPPTWWEPTGVPAAISGEP